MMLIWLLLSVTSVLTLKQYAQKTALTAATMTYSLEAAVVLPMALQQLKHWQRWASKGNFQLQKYVISSKIFWHLALHP